MNYITTAFNQNKLLFIFFIFMCLLTIFMFIKAGKSVRETKMQKAETIKKLDRMKHLHEKYNNITTEEIENDTTDDLFEGLVFNIQYEIKKSDDLNASFETLTHEQKMIYAIYYFLEESANCPSDFFRNYGPPLSPFVLTAISQIFDDESFLNDVTFLYNAFDENNESVSVIKSEIENYDNNIKEFLNKNDSKEIINSYIKRNAQKFV